MIKEKARSWRTSFTIAELTLEGASSRMLSVVVCCVCFLFFQLDYCIVFVYIQLYWGFWEILVAKPKLPGPLMMKFDNQKLNVRINVFFPYQIWPHKCPRVSIDIGSRLRWYSCHWKCPHVLCFPVCYICSLFLGPPPLLWTLFHPPVLAKRKESDLKSLSSFSWLSRSLCFELFTQFPSAWIYAFYLISPRKCLWEWIFGNWEPTRNL